MSVDQSQMNILHQDDSEIDLMDLFRTLWRGKFWIALCTVLALAIGIWYGYFKAVPVYTADAVVVLETRQEQVVDIESVVTGLSGDQAAINTEVEVIKSRQLIEKLVSEMDLLKDPEFNLKLRPVSKISLGYLITALKGAVLGETSKTVTASDREVLDSVIDSVLGALSVSNARQTFVFNIKFTTESPQKSAAMANALARLYIQEQLAVKFEGTQQATEWLANRASELQIELEQAESAVKEFDAQTDLVSPEALIGLNRQIKDLRERLSEAESVEAAAITRLVALEEAEKTADLEKMATVAGDATLDRVYKVLKASGDATPDRGAFEARFEQILKRAELDKSRASGQVAALKASLSELDAQVAAQSDDLVKLQQLQREAEASRLIYEFVLQRLKETSIQQGIQQADSRILSQAVVPRAPSAPRKSLILALSILLGGLIGSALVLGREFTQNTFRDSDQLETVTHHPVIGQIPSIPIKKREKLLQYLFDKPTSATVEAIRNLRTSILLSDLDNPPQVILSTSSIPGEGKTTISLSLAHNLSGLGKKVLLLEGDIRRRTFAEYFDTKDKKGMASILSGEVTFEDAIFRDPMLDVDLLAGEKTQTNAADFFSSNRFREFLDGIRQKYDYIIIDAPPVLAVPDARVIGQFVDTVLYTVKWDSTTQRQVREGLKLFESVKVPVSGLVLNQINSKKMKGYGYGEAHGAYGAYYDS